MKNWIVVNDECVIGKSNDGLKDAKDVVKTLFESGEAGAGDELRVYELKATYTLNMIEEKA